MDTPTHVVLVVEDEELVRQAIVDKLVREGYATLQAKDGDEGLQVALKEHPDIILLDILMPKMDGIVMLQKLRGDAWGKEARVIVLSNVGDEAKVAQALELSVYDYYVKSDNALTDIVERVRQRLETKS